MISNILVKLSKYNGLMLLCIFMILNSAAICAQETGKVNYFDPQTWLLGEFNYSSLLNEPHDLWFDKEFDNYTIDDEAFIKLGNIDLDSIDITIVMGTWCPDSRREVPRFMKIIESLTYNKDRIKFIGVDTYKEAPIHNYDSLNIERVPTFIFYYNNKIELGRIIEYPAASLERDMIGILSKRE